MNTLTKSLAAFSLLTGVLAAFAPVKAEPAIVLPASAPAQSALIALTADPNSLLPTGTRLLSVRVSEGLATANFSREFRDNFTGGDSAEARAVNSILRTLGQFPTISRVQILVEGQPIDSLGGLLVLTDPLPVIRPIGLSGTGRMHWLHRCPTLSVRQSKVAQKRLMPVADTR